MAATEPVRRFTPQEIVAKLDSQFEKARGSGDLLFFPSTVHKHTDAGIDVRFLPFSPPSVARNRGFRSDLVCRMLKDRVV